MSGFVAEPSNHLFDPSTQGLGRFKGVVDQYGNEDYLMPVVTDNGQPGGNVVGLRAPNSNIVVPFPGANYTTNDISVANGGTATNTPTINLASGRFTALAAATTLTITNSQVAATTKVFANLSTADATGWIKNVVPSAGTITITLGAALTANANVDFHLVG